MARKAKAKAIIQPIEYVTMRRITLNATGQVFEMYSPFPSGLEGVDYQNILASKLIKTLDEFQKVDSSKCLSCGD